MSYGSTFVLTLFTNNLQLAAAADHAGVDRIGLDLERIGKAERQAGLGAWISDHAEDDLLDLKQVLHQAKLFARTNPIHSGSKAEIDRLIDAGVEVLMLPMFTTVKEAATFIRLVDQRAEVSLLIETVTAAMRIHDIVNLGGIDEIHVGLNDFYLSAGLHNHFEVLVSDFLDTIAAIIREAGIKFGFGGVGRAEDASLPIPADLVYAQYPRLHASRALVSRVFIGDGTQTLDLSREINRCRNRLDYWHKQPPEVLEEQRRALRHLVTERFG